MLQLQVRFCWEKLWKIPRYYIQKHADIFVWNNVNISWSLFQQPTFAKSSSSQTRPVFVPQKSNGGCACLRWKCNWLHFQSPVRTPYVPTPFKWFTKYGLHHLTLFIHMMKTLRPFVRNGTFCHFVSAALLLPPSLSCLLRYIWNNSLLIFCCNYIHQIYLKKLIVDILL